jgi:hypothetical protein
MERFMPWERSSNSITIIAVDGTSSIFVRSLAIIRNGPTGWHIFHGSFFRSTVFIRCAASGSNAMDAGDPALRNPPGSVMPSGIASYTPWRFGAPGTDCALTRGADNSRSAASAGRGTSVLT